MSYKSYRARKVRRHMQDNPRPSKLYLGILCTHYRNHKEFFFEVLEEGKKSCLPHKRTQTRLHPHSQK